MSRDYTEITDEQLRTINKRAIEQPSYDALREQNRVLREALQEIASDIKGNPKRKQMLADDDFWAAPGEHTLRQWIAKAALTATSQEGQG